MKTTEYTTKRIEITEYSERNLFIFYFKTVVKNHIQIAKFIIRGIYRYCHLINQILNEKEPFWRK